MSRVMKAEVKSVRTRSKMSLNLEFIDTNDQRWVKSGSFIYRFREIPECVRSRDFLYLSSLIERRMSAEFDIPRCMIKRFNTPEQCHAVLILPLSHFGHVMGYNALLQTFIEEGMSTDAVITIHTGEIEVRVYGVLRESIFHLRPLKGITLSGKPIMGDGKYREDSDVPLY